MERMMQLLYGRVPQAASAEAAEGGSSAASVAGSGAGSTSTAAQPASSTAEAAETEAGRRLAGGSGGRDPESHRLIEKRRRDRVNGALAELCCLIPSARAKQSQGRIEKAEIIEMAIQHIIVLTSLVGRYKTESSGHQIPALCAENFQQGFLDATRASLSFLTETQAVQADAGVADSLCAHLYAHLQCALQKYAAAIAVEEDSEISALLDSRRVPQPPQQQPEPPQPSLQPTPHPQLPRQPGSSGAAVREADAEHQLSPPAQLVGSESGSSQGGDDTDGPLLPGFILHPAGTHYLPLVLPRAALGKEALCRARSDSDGDGGGSRREQISEVLHPVSIPVNFRSARRLRISGRKRKRASTECWDSAAESD